MGVRYATLSWLRTTKKTMMTEELTTLTEQGLAKALAYIETTESFVVEQAPLLVQEVLKYGLFTSLFWAGFWALIFGGVMWCAVKLYQMLVMEDKDNEFIGVMVGIFPGGWCLAGCFVNLFEAMKISIAPRLYLLERLDSLL